MCNHTDRYLLRFTSNSRVHVIKQLRVMTGMSLRESVDAYDLGMVVTAEQLPVVLTNLPTLVQSANLTDEKNHNALAAPGYPFKPTTLAIAIEMYRPTRQPVTLERFAF